MKICFFTKYPPIEGGTASRAYWLVRALGERGVEVHIITDALEEELFRENINFEDPDDLVNYQPPNVYVHSLDEIHSLSILDRRTLIAKQSGDCRLASLGIEAVERYDCDLIDSYYFLPYGLAGYLTKQITNRPLILRHACSDITAVASNRSFYAIFKKIFEKADRILTHKERAGFFRELNTPPEKLFEFSSWGADNKYFNPRVLPLDLSKYGVRINSSIPVITHLGKISRLKGVYELVEAANQVKRDFLLLFVSGGPGLDEFKKYIGGFADLRGKYHFLDFLPPWKIPALLKRSRCLIHLERDFPIAFHKPIALLEALAVGTCVLASEEIYGAYKDLPELENEKNILTVNPKNIKQLKILIGKITENKNFAENIGREGQKIFRPELFSDSVSATLKLYRSLVEQGKSLKACFEELRETILKYL